MASDLRTEPPGGGETTSPGDAPHDTSDGGPIRGFLRYLRSQVLHRFGQIVLLLFAITTLLFFLLQATGNPAVFLVGEGGTHEDIERVEEFYGLDQPLHTQYVRFLRQLVVLDFGRSLIAHRDALTVTVERLGPTIELAVAAIVLNIVVSLAIGTWLGFRPEKATRRAGLVAVLVSQGIPFFVVGLILIQIFAVQLGWLPSVGRAGLVTLILPAVTLASFLLPRTVRLTATNVEETMSENYVRTIRATGASSTRVLVAHALPNALLGVVALLGVQFGFLLSGSLVVEALFAWPGLGLLLIEGVRSQDFPLIQAAVFVVAILVFIANMIADILFPLIDPRLRTQIMS